MISLIMLVFTFIILIFTISGIINTRRINLNETVEEENRLIQSIKQKTVELAKIKADINNNKIDHTTNLSHMVNSVLNLYDESNIQIPADILESLSHTRLYDEKEVFDFIENQRNYWKLENTKKPYKKSNRKD